jgi:hypothetical protein
MKTLKLVFYVIIFSGLIFFNKSSFAQSDEDCCEEDDTYGNVDGNNWQKQISDLNEKKVDLSKRLLLIKDDLNSLKSTADKNEGEIKKIEEDYFNFLGITKAGLGDYDRKFNETEKKISGKIGTPSDARKFYFDEIESSKVKCLPEYNSRYIAMKQKLELWEKEGGVVTSKELQYTVIKGDCLSYIASKKDHYGNGKYWPIIWDSNKDGVISAPNSVSKTITNPNLIYPGQVLRIPALSQENMKKIKDKTIYERKDLMKKEKKNAKDKLKHKKTKNKKKSIKD